MKAKLFNKISYNIFYSLKQTTQRGISIILALKKQNNFFDAVVTFTGCLLFTEGIVTSLYRPVARNGIEHCSR
jgi:hypothetical protein